MTWSRSRPPSSTQSSRGSPAPYLVFHAARTDVKHDFVTARVGRSRARALAILVAAACGSLAGCGNGPPEPAKTLAYGGKCPTDATVERPLRAISPGPTLDGVTIAAPDRIAWAPGESAPTGSVRIPVKALMAIRASSVARVSISGRPSTGNGEIRFAYFAQTTDWSRARRVDAGSLQPPPSRGREDSSGAQWIDLPGYMFVSKLGCYEVTVEVNGKRIGPLGIGFGSG